MCQTDNLKQENTKSATRVQRTDQFPVLRRKYEGPYGKSCCWQCGNRDIWKRRCGKCFAKYCATCLSPGPVLEKCDMCERILAQRAAVQPSYSLVVTLGSSLRKRLTTKDRSPTAPTPRSHTFGNSGHSIGRPGSEKRSRALMCSRTIRRITCSHGGAICSWSLVDIADKFHIIDDACADLYVGLVDSGVDRSGDLWFWTLEDVTFVYWYYRVRFPKWVMTDKKIWSIISEVDSEMGCINAE